MDRAKNISHFGVVEIDQKSRIPGFKEKPRVKQRGDAGTVHASKGIYLFKKSVLMDVLEADTLKIGAKYDFGKDIIPNVIKKQLQNLRL